MVRKNMITNSILIYLILITLLSALPAAEASHALGIEVDRPGGIYFRKRRCNFYSHK